jgi:hypothetical protein
MRGAREEVIGPNNELVILVLPKPLELGLIGQVERFAAKLEVETLGHFEVFHKTRVPIAEPGAAHAAEGITVVDLAFWYGGKARGVDQFGHGVPSIWLGLPCSYRAAGRRSWRRVYRGRQDRRRRW